MSYELAARCANVFAIRKDRNVGKRPLLPEDITSLTLIISKDGFNVQRYQPAESSRVYYIPKYDIMLTPAQAQKFCGERPNEEFLLVPDHCATIDTIWFYVISEPDNLTLLCYHVGLGPTMTLFATLKNVPGKSEWGNIDIVPNEYCLSTQIEKADQNHYRYDEPNTVHFFFSIGGRYGIQKGSLINVGDGTMGGLSTHEIMRRCLRIVGITRITLEPDRYYRYRAGIVPELEHEPLVVRYGLPSATDSYRYKYGGELMFRMRDTLNAPVDEAEWDRVCRRLENKLERMDSDDDDAYSKVLVASVLLITDPLPGHRRPTFHYISGFRSNHITEIVELSRGELLMKDMMPENVYSLMDNGKYAFVTHDLKREMIAMIKSGQTEIDFLSFNKWAEEKSLHPNLLKLLNEKYFDTIDLNMVKLLNKLPFGALLVDQMITAGHARLAVQLAEVITQRAYDFNYYCSRLDDLFPQCNSEETSLFKILNINRGTAKYLFENVESSDDFIVKYTAIHHFRGNLVLTDEIKGNVETYFALYKLNEHKFQLGWGDRMFDFLNYPKIAKQVLRMRRKIARLPLEEYIIRDISNKYDEIVRAYASFLDYSTTAPEAEREIWLPEHQKIYVEFSLFGTPENPLDPYEEVSSREKDANRALEIYQNKANEKIKDDNEQKFSFRKAAINKLRSLASLEKDSPSFAGYTVMAPTQIYGACTFGSVEAEAYDLAHCLFRCYTNRIISGEYTVLWLRKKNAPETSLITIGITSDGRIEQTRGYGDRDATVEEAKAIAAWAKSKQGLVTFKSEGHDIAPGGWPNLAVPSLPKPSKDWLLKLRQNHAVAQ